MMRHGFRIGVVALVAQAFALSASAQVAISGLPSASALGGSELVPVVQAGITSKTTAGAIGALAVALPNTWALGQVFSAGTSSTPFLSLTSGSVLTSPTLGAVEWDGSNLSVTKTGPTRERIAYADLSNLTGNLPVANGGTGSTTASGALAALGAAPLAGATFTGEVVTPAVSTSGAGLNLPHGVAPTSPVNGDVWTTAGGLYVRVNGATVGPMSAGGGAVQAIEVRNQQASGTGNTETSFSTSSWNHRTFNTTGINTISGASLSSNRVALPSGSYTYCFTSDTIYLSSSETVNFGVRLYDYTGSTQLGRKEGIYVTSGTQTPIGAGLCGAFTLASSGSVGVDLWVTAFPQAYGITLSTGDPEVYSTLVIQKIG